MSDVAIMTALIAQHAYGKDYMDRKYAATNASSKSAAEALYTAGFRMQTSDVDHRQDEAIRRLESQIDRLTGWSGLSA